MTAQIIEKLATLVSEYYVFPEVGAAVADRLRENLKTGRYDDLGDPEAFGALVTADLQLGNNDKHLRLKYHVDEVVDETDEGAEYAFYLEQSRLNAGGMARVERLPGNIGVLEIRPLLYGPETAGDALAAAMTLLAATNGLLLDLRGCRGGSPHMVALVCSYLLDAEPVHLNDLHAPADGTINQYWSVPHLAGPRYGSERPLWILTSGTTFSGGEELSYDLQQLKRATLVGERTGGGAHPREGFKLHPHLEATIPIQRTVNPISGTNWEGVGVQPEYDVPAEQAFDVAYAQALDQVLADPGTSRAVRDEARTRRRELA
ncbi:S41 family peptidase [Kribbella deserti]|uniref:S41 family peptidase n=1 Tax=Kribbella deserti TaxID=1926257 RepID=A0ABV6QK00_9ACTN